jgi:hypothetical protein
MRAQRGSVLRWRVCSERVERSIRTERSGAVPGVTREAKGWPSAVVASVPTRAARRSIVACRAGVGPVSGVVAIICSLSNLEVPQLVVIVLFSGIG